MFQRGHGLRLRDRGHRAQVGRRPTARPIVLKVAGRHQVVEHRAQARRRREPGPLEVAQARSIDGGPRQGAQGRHDRAARLRRARPIATYTVHAGLADQVHGRRRSNAATNEVAVEELHALPRGLRERVASETADDARCRPSIAFTLPRGYVDATGSVHREGTMRLATARDEIEPLRDAEVRQNEAYLSVLLLARVVTRHRRGHRDHAGGGRGPVRGGLRPPPAPLRADQHRRRGGGGR